MLCIFFAGTKISHLLNTVKAEGADPSPTVSLTGKNVSFFDDSPYVSPFTDLNSDFILKYSSWMLDRDFGDLPGTGGREMGSAETF